ncbi:hypothetical protein X749_03625 [Mesorhizobium sp. LNJC391B00]|nr:hypothetical protein X749_03625 [Mesorhizobium sp. LNJC391B00]
MRREDGAIFLTVAENDRLGIATTIERLIDLLDAMSPDPDLEESLGWGYGSQLELHAQDGEREEENEHGGDVQDDTIRRTKGTTSRALAGATVRGKAASGWKPGALRMPATSAASAGPRSSQARAMRSGRQSYESLRSAALM